MNTVRIEKSGVGAFLLEEECAERVIDVEGRPMTVAEYCRDELLASIPPSETECMYLPADKNKEGEYVWTFLADDPKCVWVHRAA